MLSVAVILLVCGIVLTLYASAGKVALWIPVLLLFIWALLTVIPKG